VQILHGLKRLIIVKKILGMMRDSYSGSKAFSNSAGSGSKNSGGTVNFPRAEPGTRLATGGCMGTSRATGLP